MVLGIGLFRAWSPSLFSFDAFPTVGQIDYITLVASASATAFALSFFAHRITPLYKNRPILIAAVILACGGTLLLALATWVLENSILKTIAFICAGCGSSVILILWSEFFGSLSPLRVALYYSLAIFLGAALMVLFLGLDTIYVVVISVFLPLVCLMWFKESMGKIEPDDLPKKKVKHEGPSFPIKPVVLMSLCAFVIGFTQLSAEAFWYPAGYLGELLVSALLVFGILSSAKYFNFGIIYRIALPLIIISMLFIAPNLVFIPEVSVFLFDGGYSALAVLIMIIMSNITYRFGANAVWINGFERGVRYLALTLGWVIREYLVPGLPEDWQMYTQIIVIAGVVVAFAIIFFSEDELSSRWGVSLRPEEADKASIERAETFIRVSEVAKNYQLTSREEEVLQLLAKKESLLQIEKELYIAEGTLRAHISHIYQKTGVHSRKELLELLG